ncbi:hypothetical protein PRNP1_007978 [Phytophthora ramorum]
MASDRRSDKEWLYRAACEGGLLDTVRVLLEEGDVDVNAALDDWGTTPLMFSTQKGHLAVMHYLLEHGAEVDEKDTNGATALMYHCGQPENVSLDVLKFLATDMKADVNAVDNGGRTPLMIYVLSRYVSLDVVKFLVMDMKVDVNAVDNGGRTPLMYASDSRNVSLDVMKFLVTEAKADANAVDKYGETPLMWLCRSADVWLDMVEFLVTEAKADVNAVDNMRKSALIQAAFRGYRTTVEKLLSLDADPTLRDKNYKTARDYAVRNGHVSIQHTLLSLLDNDQFISNSVVKLPEQCVIPATEIEFGDCDNRKDIGGDFHGMWLDAEVVLKLWVSNSDDGSTAFHEQVGRWYALRHPNIQKLYGAVHEGYRLFVCEHMAGGSLAHLVFRRMRNQSDFTDCLEYLYEAALGLQFLHERGIVHGDVRLENVLIGSDDIAKLANVSMEETKTFGSDVCDLGKCLRMLDRWKQAPIGVDNHMKQLIDDIISPSSPPTIPNVVSRMKRLLDSLSTSGQPEQEPSVSVDDIFDTLHNIQDTVRELGVPHYCEVAHVLDVMCNKVIAPDQHLTQSAHDAAIKVLEDIKSAVGPRNSFSSSACSISNSQSQIAIQRLSRSCANDGSLDFFYKKMERWLNVFEASSEMYQELATRWADITKRKIELFVSEVDKSLTLLRDVDPDDLVTLLYHESQSQKYSPSQREIIQKAYKDLFTKRSTELFVSPPEWFIGWYELENEIEFARGGFGDVSRAKWLNSDVVVKRMRRDNDHVDRSQRHKEFKYEVGIWFRLNHPHVVKLFGGCHIGTPFFVCEDAKLGQLDSYLKTRSSEVWQKLYEAALGLEYLHARNIVHGDLKCNNILVGSDGQAKLTDFGLSTSASGNENVVTTAAIRWSAPECLKGEKATSESDVFSLGMCIIEAVTGAVPWATIDNNSVKYHVLKERKLPLRRSGFTDPQWKLVEDMCQFERSRRLKLLTVVHRLKEFAFEHPIAIVPVKVSHNMQLPTDDLIQLMKEMLLQCKADVSKRVSVQTYELLLERIEDLYVDNYEAELEKAIKAKLAATVSAAHEYVAELPKQLPPVEGVKSVFRGFSLHRRIDRVLAEYFMSPSSDVHQWKTKCSMMLQSLKAGE